MVEEQKNVEVGKSFFELSKLFLFSAGFLLIGAWTFYNASQTNPDIPKIVNHLVWLTIGVLFLVISFFIWLVGHRYTSGIYKIKQRIKKEKIKGNSKIIIELKKNWPNLFWQFIILVGLGLIFTLVINHIINPNPEVDLDCYYDGEYLKFILNNPSRSPAEDYNFLIYEKYWHGHGSSYAVNDLCTISPDSFQPEHTLVQCEYIPPLSSAEINIDFENKSLTEIRYSSWGKTTPKKEGGSLTC